MVMLATLGMTLVACSGPRETTTSSTERSPVPTRGPERYVAIGASDSVGVGARDPATGSWPARVAATLVSVWLAVNDLNAGIDAAQYGASLDALLDLLVPRTRATVFVGNVPDLRAVPVYARLDPQVVTARVNAFNAEIARSAARHPGRVVVVDLHAGSAELVGSATVSADGFHPSDRGYELIAERFLTAMRQAGVRVTA